MPFYDSLLAKLIVGGETRADTIDKLSNCLEAFEVDGIQTTIPFHLKAISHAAFRSGKITTRWIEEHGLTSST